MTIEERWHDLMVYFIRGGVTRLDQRGVAEAVQLAIAEAEVQAVTDERVRVMGRLREAIVSWDQEPDLNLRGIVKAAFEVFACCLTHAGVTLAQARNDALNPPRPDVVATENTPCLK